MVTSTFFLWLAVGEGTYDGNVPAIGYSSGLKKRYLVMITFS
jgi:hypothetical protein